MKEQNQREVYCTNMEKNDPIIEKFIKEYLEEKRNAGEMPKADDLIVNFNITYADGEDEHYTCGAESVVFGKGEEKKDRKKEEKTSLVEDKSISDNLYKEVKDYNDAKVCECNKEKKNNRNRIKEKKIKVEENEHYYAEEKDNDINFNYEDYLKDFEPGKWVNCTDEWSEGNRGINSKKNRYYHLDIEDREFVKKEDKKKHKGKITVYSILSCEHSQTLKGVKINLYKINGITPKLIDSKATDEDGKVVFKNIENGCYRVIEIIDKGYFEKPTYLTWNEFNINDENTSGILYVLNYLKQFKKY